MLTSSQSTFGVRLKNTLILGVIGLLFGVSDFSAPAAAQVDPNSGIDFVTITHPNNPAVVDNGINSTVNGRGSVPYEYRIGRFEVTTAQWVEFFNAAFDRAPGEPALPWIIPPDGNHWGAVSGGAPGTNDRWRVASAPGSAMRPVGDISWRMGAMYCNWLHNNKSRDFESFMNGAYDVRTFGSVGGIFQDQAARSPSARYYIPTWDEWLKAAHYDPNKANADGTLGGWWRYSNGSDTPYAYGPAGVRVGVSPTTAQWVPDPNGQLAQANAGWDERTFPGADPFAVPLGSYAISSPWGLKDVAGGTAEWTETIMTFPSGDRYRFHDGSSWVYSAYSSDLVDRFNIAGAEYPYVPTQEFGLRIAAAIPTPSAFLIAVVAVITVRTRSQRRCQ